MTGEGKQSEAANATRQRFVSEKEERIAEKVKQIKLNMIKHEQRKKLMSQLKPYLVAGSILLLGVLAYFLSQFYSQL